VGCLGDSLSYREVEGLLCFTSVIRIKQKEKDGKCERSQPEVSFQYLELLIVIKHD
jgi:hypothetical protein